MAKFTVRVELRDADREDYSVLYEGMEEQGFTDIITDSNEIAYRLPDAEYNYEGDISRSAVLAKAQKAADATGLRYSVLVTQSAGRTWHGLKRA